MKKLLIFILALSLCLSMIGCDSSESSAEYESVFLSEDSMKTQLANRYWSPLELYASQSQKVFYFEDNACTIYEFTDGITTGSFSQALKELSDKEDISKYDYIGTFLDTRPQASNIKITTESITYDYENDTIKSNDSDLTWRVFDEDSIVYDGAFYDPDYGLLSNYFSMAKTAVQNELEEEKRNTFLSKYPSAVSYEDVKYDPYKYLGDKFSISGTVELEDYFNYEYRDLESAYFCLWVTPTGKSKYTDGWYIYAKRSEHSSLLSHLKENSECKITMICKAEFTKATQNSMGTLVDYIIE